MDMMKKVIPTIMSRGIRVKSVSDTKLIIELLNDDNQTVDDTRDCVKQ